MDLNYLDYLGIRVALGATLPALGQTDLPAVTASEVEAFETQSDEDEELFRSGDLIVPSTLKSEFFEVDFSLHSVAPPSFAASVMALDGCCLPLAQDLSLSAVAEVLSCFQPLQGLERQSFLSAPKLPRLLRAVPPASALCKTFAAAKVHGYRVAFSGPCSILAAQ
eukprot:g28896.t1